METEQITFLFLLWNFYHFSDFSALEILIYTRRKRKLNEDMTLRRFLKRCVIFLNVASFSWTLRRFPKRCNADT